MYVQPLEGSMAANPLSSVAGSAEGEGPFFQGAVAPAAGDNISRFLPPGFNGSAAAPYNDPSMQGLFGPLMGMLQQLMQMLQSLMGYGGCSSPYGGAGTPYGGNGSTPYTGNGGTPYAGNGSCQPYGNGSCQQYGNEKFFQSATGASQGDPHLSLNGQKWKSMASQPDLLNSRSFAGGYQISTQATQPNEKGVTWNQSATVALNGGATTISLNNSGQPSITRDGQAIAIAQGQTIRLGHGESVTYAQNGALTVNAQNGTGGQITTTLTSKGNGVDVEVDAHDVDLGGALVNGFDGQRGPGALPGPWPSPWSGPHPDY